MPVFKTGKGRGGKGIFGEIGHGIDETWMWRRDESRLYSITYVRGTRFEIAVSKWYGILPMDWAMSSMRFASP